MLQLRAIAEPAIYRVVDVSKPDRPFLGTAFAIGPRHALTCRHVIETAAEDVQPVLIAHASVGDIGRLKWICHDDEYLDVAVTQLPDDQQFQNWLTPMLAEIQVDQEGLVCFGFPSASEGLDSWTDQVSGYDNAHGLVKLQGSFRHGLSGGPVLDAKGNSVAINVARRTDGTQKYVLPMRAFYVWLQKNDFRPEHGAGLLAVPIAPPVAFNEIPQEVIEAFADAFPDEVNARAHLARMSALIRNNNPEGLKPNQIELLRRQITAFSSPEGFWNEVFALLATKSRRSIAALLDADGAPDPRLQETNTGGALRKFRQYLANPF